MNAKTDGTTGTRQSLAMENMRNPRRGIILLSTLISVTLLATLLVALQSRAQANLRILARLERAQWEAIQRDAIHERLRGLLADAMTAGEPLPGRPRLNGTPFQVEQGGRRWEVRVQDVAGLVDVYLARPEVLALLPIDTGAFSATRTTALAKLPPGVRFPVLAQSLARFGLTVEVRQQLAGMVTQVGRDGRINLDTAPKKLEGHSNLPASARSDQGQVVSVHISVAYTE